jgi:hypothetical protein
MVLLCCVCPRKLGLGVILPFRLWLACASGHFNWMLSLICGGVTDTCLLWDLALGRSFGRVVMMCGGSEDGSDRSGGFCNDLCAYARVCCDHYLDVKG